ncbi:MAG: hypothetical protein K6F00_06985, partial [Lachnospiraceae bacterium]|nr:hypothetical protein [Lachnospiraceae bacterium]
MRRLIRADLRRILRRPTYYLWGLAILALAIIMPMGDNAAGQIESMRMLVTDVSLMVLSIPIFNRVFADELNTGSMQCAIGRGMSRTKIIIAKLWDSIILLSSVIGVLFIAALIKNHLADVAVTPRQNAHLFAFFVFSLIAGIAFLAVAELI